MYQIEGYEWAIYGLSLLSVMLLGQFTFLKPKAKFKSVFSIGKIACLIIFVITSMYWIITFPSVGWTYNFAENNDDYSKDIPAESVENDIKDNQIRIKVLERELERTQDDLRAVTGRINLFLQIAMYGMIYFGVGFGVRSFQKDRDENKDS